MLGELVPLALVVALSPVSIIPAVLLVLHTDHPRPTGLAFMAGWLIGLAALTAVFVAVPHLVDGLGESPPWMPWVRIAIGALLIVAAIGRWLTRSRTTRPPAFLDRLGKITPAGAAIIGFGLVVANPKVLVMNAAAGLIIGTAAAGATVWIAVAVLHRPRRFDGDRTRSSRTSSQARASILRWDGSGTGWRANTQP